MTSVCTFTQGTRVQFYHILPQYVTILEYIDSRWWWSEFLKWIKILKCVLKIWIANFSSTISQLLFFPHSQNPKTLSLRLQVINFASSLTWHTTMVPFLCWPWVLSSVPDRHLLFQAALNSCPLTVWSTVWCAHSCLACTSPCPIERKLIIILESPSNTALLHSESWWSFQAVTVLASFFIYYPELMV